MADADAQYPVVVFLHGESFSWGSGNLHDGRVLATFGKVVVITLNYRLGVFGKCFLPLSYASYYILHDEF